MAKSPKNILLEIPFYLIILCLYPVLFLWAANFVQVPAFVILRSLLISVIIAAVVCLASLVIMRDLGKGALFAGLVLILVFFYGQFFSLVDNRYLFGLNVGRHRFILPLCGILLAVSFYLIYRTKSDLRNLTGTFNLVGGVLFAITLIQLGGLIINDPTSLAGRSVVKTPASSAALVQATPADTPDVYYILIDGYDRQDLMKLDVHLDNQQFISSLENMGFVVPDCTQSNYTTTVTSMSATLNMEYIDQLGLPHDQLASMSLNDYTAWLQPYLLNNQVMQNFRELGYKIITLKNIFSFINFPNSDIVYDFDSLSSPLQKLEAYNFQYMFLRTTMVRVLIEEEELSPDKFKKLPVQILELINPRFTQENYFYNKFFLQNLYQLDSLENIYQIPGKKFLYAHLMAIHAPFTFTTSGEMRLNTAETKQGYADQVTYVNKRILAIVKNILANSKTPPIIILQGDHGYSLHFTKGEAVFRILNAYYLPQGGKDKLYPTITPVNTFRLIFSYYFNQDYAPLPDQSIWINAAFPGGYKIAPQTCVH